MHCAYWVRAGKQARKSAVNCLWRMACATLPFAHTVSGLNPSDFCVGKHAAHAVCGYCCVVYEESGEGDQHRLVFSSVRLCEPCVCSCGDRFWYFSCFFCRCAIDCVCAIIRALCDWGGNNGWDLHGLQSVVTQMGGNYYETNLVLITLIRVKGITCWAIIVTSVICYLQLIDIEQL